jgi:hypothetical protein
MPFATCGSPRLILRRRGAWWSSRVFRDSSIGFLLQQACEKALKSWIHATGGLAPFTHDLVALMDWLDESGADVSPFARIADLTFFAVTQ